MVSVNDVGVATIDLDELTLIVTDILRVQDTNTIYTSSGAFGSVTGWEWVGTTLVENQKFELLKEDALDGPTELTSFFVERSNHVVVFGGAVDGLEVFPPYGDQPVDIGDAWPSELDNVSAIPSQGMNLLVGTLGVTNEVSLWSLDAMGAVTLLDVEPVISDSGEALIGDVVSFSNGDTDYVAVVDQLGNSVNLIEVVDGTFGASVQLSNADGLPISTPTAIEAVEFNEQEFLIVAGAGSNSISVIAAGELSLELRDQVIDGRDTRFEGISVLEAITYEGRAYIAASGRDSGLTILTLLPDGRLQTVATLEDRVDAPLEGITALEFAVQGGVLNLIVAGEGWNGVSIIEVETGEIGLVQSAATVGGTLNGTKDSDLLSGGAGDDFIDGGAGDDILTDGLGEDVLIGGQGADVFVFDADGEIDWITDFDVAEDKINLSFWGNVYSIEDLRFSEITNGWKISFRDEVLEVLSGDNERMILADFTDAMLFDVSHIAVDTVPEVTSGDDEAEPFLEDLGEAIDLSAGTYRFGTNGDDVLVPDSEHPEFDVFAGVVIRLFQAVLGRSPNYEGHYYWVSQMLDGRLDGEGLAAALMASVEFQLLYGNTENTEFITLLFENVLGRTPADAGLVYWASVLDSGVSREIVVRNFSETPEFTELTQATALRYTFSAHQVSWMDDVYRLFRTTLDRNPGENGLQYWSDSLANGLSFQKAIEGFVFGPEFQETYGATTNHEFALLLFQNVLGRDPQESGLTYWIAQLDKGVLRPEIVEYFTQSPEFILTSHEGFVEYMLGLGLDDIVLARGGNDVLQGGGMSDVFAFDTNELGDNVIIDFEEWDMIHLTNSGFATRADVFASLEQVGLDVVLSHGGGSVTLSNFDLNLLDMNNFLI